MGDSKADREMLALAASAGLREEFRRLRVRETPLTTDEWVGFLLTYNEFIGHRPRPFRAIRGDKWRL